MQQRQQRRPRLLFFYSPQSGRCRRVEGFLAQVMQRRHNHDTFDLVRISIDSRPDLVERLRVDAIPTFLVIEGTQVKKRIVMPTGCRELEAALSPWLREPAQARATREAEATTTSA
jgi:thioredoxin-like negative regulator of GroEL